MARLLRIATSFKCYSLCAFPLGAETADCRIKEVAAFIKET